MFQKTFKALSDPVRQEILNLLRGSDCLSAGDIASRFDMSQATVSYHLKILKQADLIRERKDRNFIFYSLNTSVFEELLRWVMQFQKGNDYEKTDN